MKNNVLFVIILFCTVCQRGTGQSPSTWMHIYDSLYSFESSMYNGFLQEVKDGYICVTAQIAFVGEENKSRLTKYDRQGKILWRSKLHYRDAYNRDTTFNSILGLVMAKDSALYVFTSWLNERRILRYYVNKFDQRGRLLWHKDYGLPNESCYGRHYCIALAEDSLDIVIGGRINAWEPPFDRDHELLIVRIRPDGSQAWASRVLVKDRRSNTTYMPLSVLPDGSVCLAFGDRISWRESSPYFLKLDRNGREILGRLSGARGITSDMRLHPNGNLVYYYQRESISSPTGEPHIHGMTVRMLSPNLDTVWGDVGYSTDDPETPIGGTSFYSENLSIRNNGDILVSGGIATSAWLVAVSATGRPLWNRRVRFAVGLTSRYGGRIYGAMWTSDGGILLSGVLNYPDPANGRSETPYLMKLDSFGCLEPGCHLVNVGTDEAEARPVAPTRRLALWPNPAYDQVHIDLSELPSDNPPQLVRVWNLSGALCHEERIIGRPVQLDLAVQNWPSGLYQVVVLSKHGHVWNGVFLK